MNGVGLLITGCTRVQPNGVGFTGEFASYDDRFVPSLRRLAAAAVHAARRCVGQQELRRVTADVIAAIEAREGGAAVAKSPLLLRARELSGGRVGMAPVRQEPEDASRRIDGFEA